MNLQTFIDFLEERQNLLLSSLKTGAVPIQSEICLNGLILSTYSLEFQDKCEFKNTCEFDDEYMSPQIHSSPGWSFYKYRLP